MSRIDNNMFHGWQHGACEDEKTGRDASSFAKVSEDREAAAREGVRSVIIGSEISGVSRAAFRQGIRLPPWEGHL